MSDEQGDHLAQGQPLSQQIFRRAGGAAEQVIHPGDVGGEPDMQSIPQTVYLAITGCGGQRHRVEVIQRQLLACD